MSSGQGSTARYCSACGAECSPAANYCWNCGAATEFGPSGPGSGSPARDRQPSRTAVPPSSGTQTHSSGPSTRTSSRPRSLADNQVRDRAALERQVAIALEDGWELKHDFGDRAVLVRRRFGSVSGHILVGLATLWWTMGAGNVLYGTYRYFGDADRLVIRAEQATECTHPPIEAAGSESQLGRRTAAVYWLLATGLAIAGTLVSGTTLSAVFFLLATLAAVVGVGMWPSVRDRIDRRHSVTTIGTAHSVDERAVADPDQPCSACTAPVDPGIERTYYEDRCLFGVPVSTSSGQNHYCKRCANAERSADSSESDDVVETEATAEEPPENTADETTTSKAAQDVPKPAVPSIDSEPDSESEFDAR